MYEQANGNEFAKYKVDWLAKKPFPISNCVKKWLISLSLSIFVIDPRGYDQVDQFKFQELSFCGRR